MNKKPNLLNQHIDTPFFAFLRRFVGFSGPQVNIKVAAESRGRKRTSEETDSAGQASNEEEGRAGVSRRNK